MLSDSQQLWAVYKILKTHPNKKTTKMKTNKKAKMGTITNPGVGTKKKKGGSIILAKCIGKVLLW